MNSSSLNQVKAVMWKEWKEFIRSSKSYAIFTVIFIVVMQLMSSRQIIDNNKLILSSKEVLLGYSIIYLSLMSIPFFGSAILSRIIYEERCDNAVHVLLATGIESKLIWIGKMIIMFALSYVVFIFSTILYYVSITSIYHIKLVLSAKIIVLAFIIMPMLAFGVISIMGYLYWALKKPQIIGMIFPIIFVIGVWNLTMKLSEKLPIYKLTIGSIVIGIGLLALSILGVSRVSKERVTNVC